MRAEVADLWTVTRAGPQIDPNDLAAAIERQAAAPDLDYRSRLLIRDSVDALRSYLGPTRFAEWRTRHGLGPAVDAICAEPFEEVGFPSLRRRVATRTEPSEITRFFATLGGRLRKVATLDVTGSCALILLGLLERGTKVIDVIDEVPQEIRENHRLVDELQEGFGLHLGHVQRHYFPLGWAERSTWHGAWGRLTVRLLDVYDVVLSKLFSARIKDLTDLQQLLPGLDKEIMTDRLRRSCRDFLAIDRLRGIASENWQTLFKEDLPS